MSGNKNLNEKELNDVAGGGYINWDYDKETGTTTIDAKFTDEELDHLPGPLKNKTGPHFHHHRQHGCRGHNCHPRSGGAKPGTDTPAGPVASNNSDGFNLFS